VLSDAEKRRIYDRYGEEGLKEHEGRGGRGGGGGAQDIFSQCAASRPQLAFALLYDRPESVIIV
jgi:DnaJ-class molecular chaperone